MKWFGAVIVLADASPSLRKLLQLSMNASYQVRSEAERMSPSVVALAAC
jgi:hypothetical protein